MSCEFATIRVRHATAKRPPDFEISTRKPLGTSWQDFSLRCCSLVTLFVSGLEGPGSNRLKTLIFRTLRCKHLRHWEPGVWQASCDTSLQQVGWVYGGSLVG